MIKLNPKKSALRAWAVPGITAALTVVALELAQRVNLLVGLALAALIVVLGLWALGRRE